MRRHVFDPLSAFFGILFTAAALVVLIADNALLGWDARWVWPTAALVAGLLLVLSGLRSSSRKDGGVDGKT
jgi:hypothetical protein